MEILTSFPPKARSISRYIVSTTLLYASTSGCQSNTSSDQSSSIAEVYHTPAPIFRVVEEMDEHDRSIIMIAVSPDGKYLLSLRSDWTLHGWEISSGQLLYTLGGIATGEAVQSLAFSPDRRSFAGVIRPYKIGIWDLATGRQIYSMDSHRQFVSFLSFEADSRFLISATQAEVRRWDLSYQSGPIWTPLRLGTKELKPLWQLNGFRPRRSFWSVLVSDGMRQSIARVRSLPKGGYVELAAPDLTIASRDENTAVVFNRGTVKLWGLSTKRLLYTFKVRQDDAFVITMSPDQRYSAIGYGDCSIDVIDLQHTTTYTQHRLCRGAIKAMAFSPTQDLLFFGGEDHLVRHWAFKSSQIKTYSHVRSGKSDQSSSSR